MKKIGLYILTIILCLSLNSCYWSRPIYTRLMNEDGILPAFHFLIFCSWYVLALFSILWMFLNFVQGFFGWEATRHYKEIIGNTIVNKKETIESEGGWKEALGWASDSVSFFLAYIASLWLGIALLLLFMSHIWYPFWGEKDYNMLIKVATFILFVLGFVTIYRKISNTKIFMRIMTVFLWLSMLAVVLDFSLTLWHI